MVIHFTSSRSSVIKDFETLRKVIRVIHETGNVLARDWMEPQYHIDVTKTVKELNPRHIYDLNIDAIERADLVIIEGSFKSFGSGFQAATALHKKKPVLLLISRARVKAESRISQGINDPLLTRKEYLDHSDLSVAVKNFIEENSIKTKDLRFNFVLDPQLYNHIRWKSFKSKKTKAEVVRELLVQDMERDR
jgi:nucleoside 2-deoxyribosyltransferase